MRAILREVCIEDIGGSFALKFPRAFDCEMPRVINVVQDADNHENNVALIPANVFAHASKVTTAMQDDRET